MNDLNHILQNDNPDGIDRRGFLKCMAWAGTGVLWTVSGGVLTSKVLGAISRRPHTGDFSFVQISDSHIGFNKEANKDVIGTLQKAITKINALPTPPDFILHTGDLSHLSEAEEFDALEQNLKEHQDRRNILCAGRARRDQRQRRTYTGSDLEKSARIRVGTASTRTACTLSGWSTF